MAYAPSHHEPDITTVLQRLTAIVDDRSAVFGGVGPGYFEGGIALLNESPWLGVPYLRDVPKGREGHADRLSAFFTGVLGPELIVHNLLLAEPWRDGTDPRLVLTSLANDLLTPLLAQDRGELWSALLVLMPRWDDDVIPDARTIERVIAAVRIAFERSFRGTKTAADLISVRTFNAEDALLLAELSDAQATPAWFAQLKSEEIAELRDRIELAEVAFLNGIGGVHVGLDSVDEQLAKTFAQASRLGAEPSQLGALITGLSRHIDDTTKARIPALAQDLAIFARHLDRVGPQPRGGSTPSVPARTGSFEEHMFDFDEANHTLTLPAERQAIWESLFRAGIVPARPR